MKLHLFLGIGALCLSLSCRSTTPPASETASTQASRFMPIGDYLNPGKGSWTGRLIFPSERRADGGVWLEVYTAPRDVALPSGRVWLTLDQGDAAVKDYLARTVIDVDFTVAGKRATEAIAKGDSVPKRLDGLKAVSPLESLAGSRTELFASPINGELTADSIEVWIPDGEWRNDTLYTKKEPVQITGRKVGLVKFVGSGQNLTYRAIPYSPNDKGEFSAAEMSLQYLPSNLNFPSPVSSLDHIEDSPLNDMGWYVFGDEKDGQFTIRAMEPRGLMDPSRVSFNGEGAKYIRELNFKNERDRKGQGWGVVIQKDGRKDFAVGDKGLVIHIFGGMTGKGGDSPIEVPGTELRFYTGHFAFGVAQIVTDPFTQKPKLDIEFKQVYAHSDRGIVSGSSKWHTYSGSLQRGWMYYRSNSDIFIKMPEFSAPYRFGSEVFNPMDALHNELQVMMARFRTGDGSGVSQVNITNSCVQDSNQAMYIAVMKMLEKIKLRADLQAYIKANPQEPDVQRLARLETIMQEYVDDVVAGAALRKDWKASLEADLAIKREYPGGSTAVVNAIRTRRAIAPRWAHDNISELLHKHGATQWFVRYDQIGGWIPDIYPAAAGFD